MLHTQTGLDKTLCIHRTLAVHDRIGAARPNKSGKGSRWRVGKKAFTIPIHTEKDVIAEAG
jgi:hypothetical protein